VSADQDQNDTSVDTPPDDSAGDAGEADEAVAADTAAGQLSKSVTDVAAPAHRQRTGLIGKIAAPTLAALLLTAAGLTGWLYFFQYRADQQVNPAAQQVARQAAQDGTVALLSYSPDTLDQDLDNAESHLTGDFLKYYDDFTVEVVRPAVKQKSVQTEAKVIRAAVSEMQPDKAVVLVFVNQQTTSKDRAEPSRAAGSVRVTVNKVNGNWLISSFDPI
jgi:Mce-associated membrane protein